MKKLLRRHSDKANQLDQVNSTKWEINNQCNMVNNQCSQDMASRCNQDTANKCNQDMASRCNQVMGNRCNNLGTDNKCNRVMVNNNIDYWL